MTQFYQWKEGIQIIRIDLYTNETNRVRVDSLKLHTVKLSNIGRKAIASKRRSEDGFEFTDNMSHSSEILTLGGEVTDLNKLVDNASSPNDWTNEKAYIDKLELLLETAYKNEYLCDIRDLKRGKVYTNFIITDQKITENKKSTAGFKYNMVLQEIRTGSVGTTTIDIARGASSSRGTTTGGIIDSEEATSGKKSTLYKIFNKEVLEQ